MVKSTNSVLIVTAIASLTILIATIITATHSHTKCTYNFNDSDSASCGTSFDYLCPKPAIDLYLKLTYFGQEANVRLSCPWRETPSILNYISLFTTIGFLVLLNLAPKINKESFPVVLLICGGLNLVLLLTTFFCMVADLVKGHDKGGQYIPIPGAQLSYTLFPYVIDSLLIMLTFLTAVFLTIYGYRSHHKNMDDVFLHEGTYRAQEA